MIEWVFGHCSEVTKLTGKADLSFYICVVTDDEKIEKEVLNFGGNVVRVDDDVPSGSERIELAYRRFFSKENYDLIINVQGDEPLFKREDLEQLAKYHLSSPFDIGTMIKKQTNLTDFKNPNTVKVIWSEDSGQCHYFSRSPIPFARNTELPFWFSHVGVYSYRPKALSEFCKSGMSFYEKIESLEQLRALELGLTIGALQTEKTFIGVDRPEDIEKLVGVLSE
jgi:3-deoxy-manno-octulosonate cytidylyltransferase (CMP-KDO synthetase)